MEPETLARARALLARGHTAEALAITSKHLASGGRQPNVMSTHSAALKAAGRWEEALAVDRRAVERTGASAVAWHNLAATLGDLGRCEEAKTAAGRALAKGLDVAPTWLVYARSCLGVGEASEAQRAFEEVFKRTPADGRAAMEYSELLWMNGDAAGAIAVLRRALAAGAPAALMLAREGKIRHASDGPVSAAHFFLQVTAAPQPTDLLLVGCQSCLEAGLLGEAEKLAQRALVQSDGSASALNKMTIVRLAQGRHAEALACARDALAKHPDDQTLIAWWGIACRAADVADHREVFDYRSLVRTFELQAPADWSTPETWIDELGSALRRMHRYPRAPSRQPIRGGSQSMRLLTGSPEPAVQALFRTVKPVIDGYITDLGSGEDALRRRGSQSYRFAGAWSVLLHRDGALENHVHDGWISGIFYVQTPLASRARGRQGWLALGQPPLLDPDAFAAEHYVQPSPARLVLFPSYLWHGTIPFSTDETRLSVAFDLEPQ